MLRMHGERHLYKKTNATEYSTIYLNYLCIQICDMSQFEKLLKRFQNLPADFTYDELVRLLTGFGYTESNKGKTSGSRVKFYNDITESEIVLHKPHPDNILKKYALRQILAELMSAGFINNKNGE